MRDTKKTQSKCVFFSSFKVYVIIPIMNTIIKGFNMRIIKLGLILFIIVSLVGCQSIEKADKIEELVFIGVPSMDPELILNRLEPMQELVKVTLLEYGYEVESVEFQVSTNNSAAAEALASGATLLGYMGGSTYIDYENEGLEIIMTSLRGNMEVDSIDPRDWNTGAMINRSKVDKVSYTRALIYAGPSPKGKELLTKVMSGEKLTWNELSEANWCHSSSVNSGLGYVFPSLWLYDNYGKTLADLDNVLLMNNNGDYAINLALENCDVAVSYVTLRNDYQEKWNTEFNRSESIWDEVGVIGVTDKIMNGIIVMSKNHKDYTEELKIAISAAFLEVTNSESGIEAFGVYNIEGFIEGQSEDFETLRKAYELVKGLQ
jgi:phosphonate transport system substrate-binding protein